MGIYHGGFGKADQTLRGVEETGARLPALNVPQGHFLRGAVGAFMQVMNEDARAVSAITGLKLQMAGEIDDPVVVGGFPKSGLDQYVGKLARAGRSIAIAFQNEQKECHIKEVIIVGSKQRTENN